jgi:hypothetical protein
MPQRRRIPCVSSEESGGEEQEHNSDASGGDDRKRNGDTAGLGVTAPRSVRSKTQWPRSESSRDNSDDDNSDDDEIVDDIINSDESSSDDEEEEELVSQQSVSEAGKTRRRGAASKAEETPRREPRKLPIGTFVLVETSDDCYFPCVVMFFGVSKKPHTTAHLYYRLKLLDDMGAYSNNVQWCVCDTRA